MKEFVQVPLNQARNPAVLKLTRLMSLPLYAVEGLLTGVQRLTLERSGSAGILDYEDLDIEMIVGWDGEPGLLIKSLIGAGWYERIESGLKAVFGWDVYAKLSDFSEKERARKQRYRRKKREEKRVASQETSLSRDEDGTETGQQRDMSVPVMSCPALEEKERREEKEGEGEKRRGEVEKDKDPEETTSPLAPSFAVSANSQPDDASPKLGRESSFLGAEWLSDESQEAFVLKEPPSSMVPIAVSDFPCVGRGSKFWHLTEQHCRELQEAYPGVDVLGEGMKARQWCRDNKAQRKTARGMPKFLNGWLSRAQNRGGGQRAYGGRPITPPGTFSEAMGAALADVTFFGDEDNSSERVVI